MSSSTTRMLLTVLICMGILLVYMKFFGPKPEPPATQAPATQTTTGAKAPPPPAAGASAKAIGQATPEVAAGGEAGAAGVAPSSQPVSVDGGHRAKRLEGKLTSIKAQDAEGTFTTTGAALLSWKLLNPRYTEKLGDKLVPVDVVTTEKHKGPWPLSMTFPASDFEVPEDAEFILSRKADRELVYVWQSKKVRVTKHYVVDKTRPLLWMTLLVKNLTPQKLRQRLQVNLYNYQDPAQGKASFTNPYPKLSTVLCYGNGELNRRSKSAILGQESSCSAAGCGMGNGTVTVNGQVPWIAADSRYFMAAVIPTDTDTERRCELKLLDGDSNVVAAQLLFPEQPLLPDKPLIRRFTIFLGGKDLAILDGVTGPDKSDVDLIKSIDYGFVAVLCRPMLFLLKTFHNWFGNWGIAIILLTLVVKALTFYWQHKSMKSMKAMQRLKPKMDELRDKYKNDKARLNQETMALYKLHGVSPLGGCLPMLLQFPVWYALFRTLGNAVELYHSNFGLWIHDLTAPDPLWILPILMGIAMYAQQAITPSPMEGAQAKMMKYFMPGLFTFMMLQLPAGLTLYIFVNTVLTMVQQWYMNKRDAAQNGPSPLPGPDARPKDEARAKDNARRTRRRKGK